MEPFVISIGAKPVPKLCVDSWDTVDLVSHKCIIYYFALVFKINYCIILLYSSKIY